MSEKNRNSCIFDQLISKIHGRKTPEQPYKLPEFRDDQAGQDTG
jgi:hypothetical protein